jgi:ubiquinone/menaquinone biosynthesis C-methylase UbiE
MLERFRERSLELEHLDKGDYTPEEFEGCLIELRRVNKYLGDAGALRRSLLADINRSPRKFISILDVGAGSGELLRVTARHLRSRGIKGRLVGLEYNLRSAKSILEESKAYPEIISVRGDALALPFADKAFDYVICSLFTHHFTDERVIRVLTEMSRVASRLFVIDLHRHPIAYSFYTTIGKLFLHNRLIREDGALSILRSFRPDELRALATRAGLEDICVARKFPYRLVLSGGQR